MLFDGVLNRVGAACLRQAARGLRACVKPATTRERAGVMSLLRDTNGSAMLEFALVGPPFILLMTGILEISVMFFASSVIEGATTEAARQIRTGQIQATADPLASFQTELCDSLVNVIDCADVVFNVQTYSSFSAVSMTTEIDEDGNIINTGFAPGGSGAVTVVRAIYRWHFITPLLGNLMPEGPGGHLLVSTVAFQNEPYNVN